MRVIRLADRQRSGTPDRHGELATTPRVVHRGSLASTVIQNDFAVRPRGTGRRSSGAAPGQGPVPVDHIKGGDVMQGTRSGAPSYARHPAVELTERVLRRGAVCMWAHLTPRRGLAW